jgi:hypothetical protein
MRARNIKPGFFKNEDLADVSAAARLVFIGLWCIADREGKFEWRPKRIKAEIFPYENCDIERHLMSLHDKKFIVKYSHGGVEYGFIPNFLKHQSPHPHEAKSVIPNPDENNESNQCHDMPVTCNEMQVECNADSLNPDIMNPDIKKEISTAPENGAFSLEFLKFYESYPKHVGKKPSWEIWKKLKNRPAVEDLLSALERQKRAKEEQRQTGQFASEWPDPERWLKKERWNDEIEISEGGKPWYERNSIG